MKKIMIGLLSLFILAAMTANGRSDNEAQNSQSSILRVAALKGPTSFGAIKLFEEEPVFAQNIPSEYHLLGTPQEMVARMTTGAVDAAVLPVNLAAKMYTQGPAYPLAAVVGNGMIYLLSSHSAVEDWADLPGRQIAVAGQGATPDYLLQYFWKKNNLPMEELDTRFGFTAPQIAQNAIAGLAETVVVPEPFATMIELKAPSMRRVLDFQQTWMETQDSQESYPMTALVISPDFLEENPQAVEELLQAYEESIHWVNNNPHEAALLVEKHGVMDASLAEPAIPECNLQFIPAGEAKETLESYLTVLFILNPQSIGGRLPHEDFYLP